MRRRWCKPSGVLGAVALSLGLSMPAWAIWEGISPIQPIMPRWTWQGIERQERLQDLTPEQRERIRRLPADQQEGAIDAMTREPRGAARGAWGRGPATGTATPEGTAGEDEAGPEGEVRQPGAAEPQTEDEMRQKGEAPSPEMRRPDSAAPEGEGQEQDERQLRREGQESGVRGPGEGQQEADSGLHRTEVELKPVPKSRRAPAPGETAVTADNPIDAASTHLEMARSSADAQDWEGAKAHLRQAGDALDQIDARSDRNAQRYLDRLKHDIRSAEGDVDSHARDLDIRLQNIERNVRGLKPEER